MLNMLSIELFMNRHLQMPHARYASAKARVGNLEPITVSRTRVASGAVRKEMSIAMSTPSTPSTSAATEPTPPPDGEPTPLPPSPTRTRYQQLADQFLQAFESAVAIIPNLEAPHATTVNFVRGNATAPMKFLVTVTSGVEQHPELQALGKLDATAAQDKIQYIQAFRPLANPVAAFLKSLGFTVNAHQASLTADALQVYDITKGLARDPGSAHLATLAAMMKRDLGRRGRRSKKPAAPVTPKPPATPSTTPTTTTPPKAAAG